MSREYTVTWTEAGKAHSKVFKRIAAAILAAEKKTYERIRANAGLDTAAGVRAMKEMQAFGAALPSLIQRHKQNSHGKTVAIFPNDMVALEASMPRKKSVEKKSVVGRNPKPSAAQTRARAAFVAKYSNLAKAREARDTKPHRKSTLKGVLTGRGIRKNPVKRSVSRPAKFVIRAMAPVKSGYKYYYLRGSEFVLDIAHADNFLRSQGEAKMRAVVGSLPKAISSITLERA